MDLLKAHHAKNPETCQWVLDNVDPNTDNITAKMWRQACQEYLQSLNDGPDQVSTG